MNLTGKERAYIAGVLDSRGAMVSVPFAKTRQYKNFGYRLTVLPNKENLVKFLQEKCGGCISNYSDGRIFWQIGATDTYDLVKLVSPYLKTTRRVKQAKLILKKYEDMRVGAKTPHNMKVKKRNNLTEQLKAVA